MRIVATPIPDKSHGIRVWKDISPGNDIPENRDPYTFACNLVHVDDDTCELAQAIGTFNRKVALFVGLKALELGYKKMVFYRPAGKEGTRYASYVSTENGFDHYEVDLLETALKYQLT